MLAIVSRLIPTECEKELIARNLSVIKLPPHPILPEPLASHPDMLLFFAPHAIICTEEYAAIAKKELMRISEYCKKEIRITSQKTGKAYPEDILLNAAPIGDRLFCLPRYTATELTENHGFRICSVKQGYAKCSVVPIGTDALITEDPSIAKVAENEGLEVLRIAPNAVYLEGYSTGFLGGCCSFAPYGSFDELFFCGDLSLHPDASSIRSFCRLHRVKPISLSHGPLCDVGTMFIL